MIEAPRQNTGWGRIRLGGWVGDGCNIFQSYSRELAWFYCYMYYGIERDSGIGWYIGHTRNLKLDLIHDLGKETSWRFTS